MSRDIPMTEAGLRKAMKDERYWKSSHPERVAYVGWVTEGWQTLSHSATQLENGQAVVFVRPYDRSRGGKQHHVSAHTRSALAHEGGTQVGEAKAGSAAARAVVSPQAHDVRVVPVQLGPMLVAPKPPNILPRPTTPRGTPTNPEASRQPMERIPNQSGKEGATNIPDWARGSPRFRGEDPVAFATRLMNERYGKGQWGQTSESRGPRSEFQRLKKFGQRAFREEVLGIFGLEEEDWEA